MPPRKAWRYKLQDYANTLTRRKRRGISYLKIDLRWLNGALHKGRTLLTPSPLLPNDPQPCFASYQAEAAFYDQFWFSRIRSLSCKS